MRVGLAPGRRAAGRTRSPAAPPPHMGQMSATTWLPELSFRGCGRAISGKLEWLDCGELAW